MQDEDKKHSIVEKSEMVGDEDVAGSMASPESDDDVLDSAHEMGLYQKASEEHPKEVGIAKQVDEAEKIHRESD